MHFLVMKKSVGTALMRSLQCCLFCSDLNLQDYLLMPKLMLSQLRMLDHLVNGKVFIGLVKWC